MNQYPISASEGFLSLLPLMVDLISKKSKVRIWDYRLIRNFTTSANFTSTVNTCRAMSGVSVKKINGNTFDVPNRAMMWLNISVAITIIVKIVTIKASVNSTS